MRSSARRLTQKGPYSPVWVSRGLLSVAECQATGDIRGLGAEVSEGRVVEDGKVRVPAVERRLRGVEGGRADSAILQEFGPKMARRDYAPTGRIDNMMKDLEAVQAFSGSQRLPLPVTGLVTDLHRSLLAAGLGPRDTAAIMLQFTGFREQSDEG